MKILITGVAGLIGSNFSDWIIENKEGIKVLGIDDLSGGYRENISSEIDFYNINLIEYEKLEEIFKNNNIDYVYHFAAYAAEGLSPFMRKYNYNNNLSCTVNLINLSIKYKIKRIIFTSSMAVYGNGKTPFDEKDLANPIDPYGVAKLACEMDLKIAKDQHKLDYCILRPHNVYGKKQNIWDKYRNVLGIWMNKYINNEPISIHGDGEQKRAFTYIGDIMIPLWNSAFSEKASGEIINLGGIYETSINEAKDIFLDVINNKEYPIKYEEKRHEVKNAWSTYEKSVDILDFKHKTSLKKGLCEMLVWAKKQPNRKVKKWDNYEIENGLYNFWK